MSRLMGHPTFNFAREKRAKTGCARHNWSKLHSALAGTVFATKIAEARCYALAAQLTLLQTKSFKNYGIQIKSKHCDE